MTSMTFLRGAIAALLLVACLRANTESTPAGIGVRIWGSGTMSGGNGHMSLSGTYLNTDPSVGGGLYRTTGSVNGNNGATVYPNLGHDTNGLVRVEPDKVYQLLVGGQNLGAASINVIAPPGYTVYIDGVPKTRVEFNGPWSFYFQVRSGAPRPASAGASSEVGAAGIEWRVGLGALRNGSSAGSLDVIDTGTRSDWSPIWTPSHLNYETDSSEVWVYRVNDIIEQIGTNEATVDVHTNPNDSSYYELHFYHPSQVTAGTPRTFNSPTPNTPYTPYIKYRVAQGGTTKTLAFTKEIREISSGNLIVSSANRTEVMSLARDTSSTYNWPNHRWTRSGWTLNGSSAVAETKAEATGSGTNRTSETIKIQTVGGSPSIAATITRNYTNVSGLGEVVSSESAGTSTGLTTSYTYNSNTSSPGTYGLVEAVTMPGSNWASYEYYDPSSATSTGAGTFKRIFRPFEGSPSSASQNTGQGEVTYFEYTADAYGANRAPSLFETYVSGTKTAKTTFSYNFARRYANGQTVVRVERYDHFDSSSMPLQTITCYYREDFGDPLFRGQVFTIKTPDNVQKSFAHRYGTWDDTNKAFAKDTSNPGSGTASRVTVITGQHTYQVGTASISSYEDAEIDEIWLVPNKSTAESTIRDERGFVVRTEIKVWMGSTSGWQLTGWTNHTYDYLGRRTGSISNNGAQSSATFANGIKTSDTDENGVQTTYDSYDSARRLTSKTRVGSGVIPSLVTSYAYDAAGNITTETVSNSGATESIVTARQFDDAGRLTSENPPGSHTGTTTHAYNVTNRTHTITRPDGGQVVRTYNSEGRLLSLTGNATVAEYHDYGVETSGGSIGQRWHQVNLGTSSSGRWSKRWTDWLGREVKTQRPAFQSGTHIEERFYDGTTGLLTKSTKTGVAPTLYKYDLLSQLSRTALDVNNNGSIDDGSTDRITDLDTYVELDGGNYWLRKDTWAYGVNNDSTRFRANFSRQRLTGHDSLGGVNTLSETYAEDAEGNWTRLEYKVHRTNRTADLVETREGITGSKTTEHVNGLVRKVTDFSGVHVTTGYDGLLRPSTSTSSRNNNVTTTAYVTGTRQPSTVTDDSGASVGYSYDTMGRVANQRDQRNHFTRFSYNYRDQLEKQWGDGAMPVEYGYDTTYGDRVTMKTFRAGSGWDSNNSDTSNAANPWPSSPGTGDTTTWVYDTGTGLVSSTIDAATRTVSQTFNASGSIATITNARSITKTFGYDNATGELTGITYSDSTPGISYTYTRLGQVATVNDNVTGIRTFTYHSSTPWRLKEEQLSSFYGSRYFTPMYEASGVVGRLQGFKVGSSSGSNSDLEQTFGYTAAGRFETLTSGRNSNATSRTFRYGYLSGSDLVQSLSIDGGHAFTVTRSYDPDRDLVSTIETKWSTTSLVKYDFTYDERRNRTYAVQTGTVFSDYTDGTFAGTFRKYDYNGRGELTSDVGYMGTSTSNLSHQMQSRYHAYSYDNAGNRLSSNRTSTSALADEYTTNALNQYETRENNTLSVSGTANTDSVVAVKGNTQAAGRRGRYWGDEVVVNNLTKPWYGNLSIFTAKPGTGGAADLYRTDVRTAQLAKALQSFSYDNDGNLTSDGIWDYSWDGENRLVSIETNTNAANVGFPKRRLEFKYDYMHRRVQKRVLDTTSGSSEISSRRFLYDGWNLIGEFQAPGGTSIGSAVRSYTWGLDIVHTRHQSGGVGALLQIADHGTGNTYLPAYDGNGNIAALINAANGNIAAVYEYSPYGEPLRAQVNDSTVVEQPFRFSTKFTDLEVGLVYYGHRYYNPREGRFIGRDPIKEQGGLNPYGFASNNPVNRWDVLGMYPAHLPTNRDDEVEEVTYTFGDGAQLITIWHADDTMTGWLPGITFIREPDSTARPAPIPDTFGGPSTGASGTGGLPPDDFIMPAIGVGVVIASTTPIQGQPPPPTTTVQIFARPIFYLGFNIGFHSFVVVRSGSQSAVLSAMPSRDYTSFAEEAQNLTEDVGINILPQDPQPQSVTQSFEWRTYTQARLANPSSVYESNVFTFNGTFDQAMTAVNAFNSAINNQDIPYISTTTNSNAYAFSLANQLTGIQVIPQPTILGSNIMLLPMFQLVPMP